MPVGVACHWSATGVPMAADPASMTASDLGVRSGRPTDESSAHRGLKGFPASCRVEHFCARPMIAKQPDRERLVKGPPEAE